MNFPTLDFLIRKIKEREYQKFFCRSSPYFYTIHERLASIQFRHAPPKIAQKRQKSGSCRFRRYQMWISQKWSNLDYFTGIFGTFDQFLCKTTSGSSPKQDISHRCVLQKNKLFPGRFPIQPSAANGRERICFSPKYHVVHIVQIQFQKSICCICTYLGLFEVSFNESTSTPERKPK